MMTKKRTSAISSIKLLIALPVLVVVFLLISSCRENTDIQKSANNAGEVNNLSSNLTGTETMPPPPPPPPPPVASEGTNGQNSAEAENTPYTDVDEMPLYPGGDQALLNYIGNNTNYPEKAKKENIQGRVIVRFCVNENGTIGRVSTLKSVSPELDAEAVRVVKTLPAFKPGKLGGKEVPVWYMVPITFTLK